MAADITDRLQSLSAAEQTVLVDTYWHALQTLHADGRDSVLGPLLDDAADRTGIDRDALALAAGRLGSGMRHYTHTHDSLADAVAAFRERIMAEEEQVPDAAAAATAVLDHVLPAFMREIDLSEDA